jgi:hypothetical protein
MKMSEKIDLISDALSKAQSKVQTAKKDANNPFFKSKYADLASNWEACRGPLTENGLAVVQFPTSEPLTCKVERETSPDHWELLEVEGTRVSVETVLTHSSGQFFSEVLSAVVPETKPQAIGSAITYLRRYMLQSVAGVAPEEDDGEAAHGRQDGKAQYNQRPAPQQNRKPANGTPPTKKAEAAKLVSDMQEHFGGEKAQAIDPKAKLAHEAGMKIDVLTELERCDAAEAWLLKCGEDDLLTVESLNDLNHRLSARRRAIEAKQAPDGATQLFDAQ